MCIVSLAGGDAMRRLVALIVVDGAASAVFIAGTPDAACWGAGGTRIRFKQ